MRAARRHHAVAHDLGDDRGGGDRLRALVALDHRLPVAGAGRAARRARRPAPAAASAPGRRAARRIASRLALRMSVRSMVSAEHEANETASAFFRMIANSASRSSCGQPLGIVEPLGDALGVEDHRGRHDRPGQRPAAGLVEPGHRPDAALHRASSRWRSRGGSLPSRTRAENQSVVEPSCGDARTSSDSPQASGPGAVGGRHRRLWAGDRGPDGIRVGLAAPQCRRGTCFFHSSISCLPARSGATNRSVRSGRFSMLRPSLRAAISKRRPICQA